jgi:hypothetical protein
MICKHCGVKIYKAINGVYLAPFTQYSHCQGTNQLHEPEPSSVPASQEPGKTSLESILDKAAQKLKEMPQYLRRPENREADTPRPEMPPRMTPKQYREFRGFDDNHWGDDHVQEYLYHLAVTVPQEPSATQPQPKCPKCGKSDLEAFASSSGKRGISAKVIVHCNSCGNESDFAQFFLPTPPEQGQPEEPQSAK